MFHPLTVLSSALCLRLELAPPPPHPSLCQVQRDWDNEERNESPLALNCCFQHAVSRGLISADLAYPSYTSTVGLHLCQRALLF